MAKVCLECATPKFIGKVEKGMSKCVPCKRETHTIDAEARRPLCYDCKHFKIKCQDGLMRPALDYGPEYLGVGSCDYGENTVSDYLGRKICPKIVKHDHSCVVFERHHRAPRDGAPNPLSEQERTEWRQYLEMPFAFWLDPRRWEGIRDTHKEMFWDKKEPAKPAPVKTLALGAAVIAGMLITKKKVVDTK